MSTSSATIGATWHTMGGNPIWEGAMTQLGTATGTLSPVFASNGRTPETLPGAFAATVAGETVF
jgi:hypothetical protein